MKSQELVRRVQQVINAQYNVDPKAPGTYSQLLIRDLEKQGLPVHPVLRNIASRRTLTEQDIKTLETLQNS